MKQRDSIFPGVQSLILIVAAITGGLSQTSYCRTARLEDVTLFIQHTPTEGGTITPSAGVHHFAPNSQVTLTAVPRSGYQFVYWLGDVGDPTAGSTTVLLDKPKVVIAVFESLEQDYCARGSSAGGAGGGMIAAGSEFGQQGWMESHSRPIEPTRPSLPRFPAADVPEPGTLLLLGLGAVIARKRISADL
jgi:hypothetical protein